MTINGVLAGLVAVTAGCAFVSQWGAIIIGVISGLIVIYATLFVDNLKIDDPVGAVAVHGFNGACLEQHCGWIVLINLKVF